MEEKKSSKIKHLKETGSKAVKIMRKIGNPGILESLNKVKETSVIASEIIQDLKTPEIVKNIENFRLISENMNEASSKMQNTIHQLRETGVIDEGTELIKTAKSKINSFGEDGEVGINGKDIQDVSIAAKEMLVSIRYLMIELQETVASSKKSETIKNFNETFKEVSNIYNTKFTHAN